MVTAIETMGPDEGSPETHATLGEWSAWNLRRRLPSEHAHRVTLRWPSDVTDLTGVAEGTLKKLRAEGDHPRLYAIGRALFTTRDDLLAWFEAHELQTGQVLRKATVPRGSKLPTRKTPIRREAAEGVQ